MVMVEESILSPVKEVFFGSDDTKEKILWIKRDIAKEYINSLKKDYPDIDNKDNMASLEKYLVNDGSVEDVFRDIFRWCWFFITYPGLIDNINIVKKELSSMEKIPTTEKLSALKSEILDISSQIQATSTMQSQETQSQKIQSQQTTGYSHHVESSMEMAESKNKFINSVYKRAAQLVWTKYKFWWKSPSTWIDCSWLWQWAFTQEGIKFAWYFNAHAFSDADVDIKKEQVKPWDFMFWDQKPWTKKHNSIYHIEMVVSKPYTKNWKMYVRTLWSSTDAKDDRGNYVGNWVQFREREMKDYRHYWRPTYYYQLAQHEKTWASSDLAAGRGKPSSNLSQEVLNT